MKNVIIIILLVLSISASGYSVYRTFELGSLVSSLQFELINQKKEIEFSRDFIDRVKDDTDIMRLKNNLK